MTLLPPILGIRMGLGHAEVQARAVNYAYDRPAFV